MHLKLKCRRLLVSSTGYLHVTKSQSGENSVPLPLPFLWVDSFWCVSLSLICLSSLIIPPRIILQNSKPLPILKGVSYGSLRSHCKAPNIPDVTGLYVLLMVPHHYKHFFNVQSNYGTFYIIIGLFCSTLLFLALQLQIITLVCFFFFEYFFIMSKFI